MTALTMIAERQKKHIEEANKVSAHPPGSRTVTFNGNRVRFHS